ncbi:MAG TPA: glycosyltransferase family 39 protein [Dyadobacter sp.]|nr:glycosyltransferase family 39 protein [Dyadobacter sp.]
MALPRKTLILWFFIILKLGIHCLIIAPEYDLHRDEYLHIDQGKHLAWGFLSVPPLTSWSSWLILAFGGSVFWVKFFPALYGVLTMLLVWKATEALGGKLFAQVLGATAITFSVLLRINMLFQPNSFDVLAWTALYYIILQYIKTKQSGWLYMAGVVVSLGFLNKYNIVFLLAGLAPALVVAGQHRLFLSKHLYLAGFVTLLLIAPNLIWQYQNNWPVIHHMELLSKTQLVNVNRSDFLKEQLLYFASSIFVLIAALISFFAYQPFRKYQVFFWSFLFSLGIFVLARAKGYYAIGLYPILLAFGSVFLESIIKEKLLWVRIAVVMLIIISFVPIVKVAFPLQSPVHIAANPESYRSLGLLRWEDGKDHALPQDFADMLGWKELAAKVDKEYAGLNDKKHTIVLCDNYGQAGAINYYSVYKNIHAVTLNADYINWFPLDEEIVNVILIQNADDDDPERNKEKPLFRTIRRAGKIESKYAREVGTSIYTLENAKVSINDILKSDIAEARW